MCVKREEMSQNGLVMEERCVRSVMQCLRTRLVNDAWMTFSLYMLVHHHSIYIYFSSFSETAEDIL